MGIFGDILTGVGGALGGPLGAAAGRAIGGIGGGGDSGGGGAPAGSGDPLTDPEALRRSNDFEYGGRVGGAADEANRYRLLGANAMGMGTPIANYDQADRYMGMGDQARNSQANALGLMQGAAMGNAPSQAQIMMQQQAAQNAAAQGSLAASARGPAAMAMAQQNAAANLSAGNAQNVANMGALRAQEMAGARNAYMQGATGMRGQDFQGQQLGQQRGQYGSDMEARMAALRLQGQMGYEGMGQGVNDRQLGARMGYRGAQDTAFANQQGINQQSRANDIATANAVINGIGTAGKMAAA